MFEPKVEGVRPSKTFFLFFIFCFRKEAGNFSRFTCLQKKKHVLLYYAHVKRLHSLKWRGLYGDTTTMQELLLKTCTRSTWSSGMKLSLNRIWDRTEALTGVSRSTAQKIVEEKKKAHDEQQQPKQPPSSTSKVSLDDFDQGVVRWTIASIYSLKKVLPTLDNIRSELKQGIGNTGSLGRLRKDLLYTKSVYTRFLENQKVLMERQDVVLSRIRYLRMVRELRKAGYTDLTYVHTSHAVLKCWKDSTTRLKITFSKGNLRIVELYGPWFCTIITF